MYESWELDSLREIALQLVKSGGKVRGRPSVGVVRVREDVGRAARAEGVEAEHMFDDEDTVARRKRERMEKQTARVEAGGVAGGLSALAHMPEFFFDVSCTLSTSAHARCCLMYNTH